MRLHPLLVALACLSTAACAARPRRAAEPRPADLAPVAPGSVALGPPTARASGCRVLAADGHARGLGYVRQFSIEDTATGPPPWTRSLTLDVDSAGRPRRLRALASLPAVRNSHGSPHSPGAASTRNSLGRAERLDVVVAFLSPDGHVESGLLTSRGVDEPVPNHYYTGDPLPARLHAASIRLARLIRERCAR